MSKRLTDDDKAERLSSESVLVLAKAIEHKCKRMGWLVPTMITDITRARGPAGTINQMFLDGRWSTPTC